MSLSVLLVLASAPAAAQEPLPFAGRWTLDRQASDLRPGIGFGFEALPTGDGGSSRGGSGGRRGRGGGASSGSPGAFAPFRESADDAHRKEALTEEARIASSYLVITTTPTSMTVATDRSVVRTFHPGASDLFQLGDLPLSATTRLQNGRLTVRYQVEDGRQLEYDYSLTATPRQLTVEIRFVERGGGDVARRVYTPLGADDPLPPPTPEPQPQLSAAAAASSGSAGSGGTPSGSGAPPPPAAPPPAPIGALVPDGELKGLTALGLVVEEPSGQAAACGVKRDAIEAAVGKIFTDAGFKVRRNSDEDTYLYVNVMTTSLPSGYCVSRYDASIFSMVTATVSYQSAPALLQVVLLHAAGIGGSAANAHGDTVIHDLERYVGGFTARIRAASGATPSK